MKILIKENRLREIQYKYLTDTLWYYDYNDGDILIYNTRDEDDDDEFILSLLVEYRHKNMRLRIEDQFFDNFLTTYCRDYSQATEVFKSWFTDMFGVDVLIIKFM